MIMKLPENKEELLTNARKVFVGAGVNPAFIDHIILLVHENFEAKDIQDRTRNLGDPYFSFYLIGGFSLGICALLGIEFWLDWPTPLQVTIVSVFGLAPIWIGIIARHRHQQSETSAHGALAMVGIALEFHSASKKSWSKLGLVLLAKQSADSKKEMDKFLWAMGPGNNSGVWAFGALTSLVIIGIVLLWVFSVS